MRNRELWAHFTGFGKVGHMIRDGFADATIYFEDMTGPSRRIRCVNTRFLGCFEVSKRSASFSCPKNLLRKNKEI